MQSKTFVQTFVVQLWQDFCSKICSSKQESILILATPCRASNDRQAALAGSKKKKDPRNGLFFLSPLCTGASPASGFRNLYLLRHGDRLRFSSVLSAVSYDTKRYGAWHCQGNILLVDLIQYKHINGSNRIQYQGWRSPTYQRSGVYP